MAGGVRGPRDAVDRGSVVAQPRHRVAGHTHVKDDHLGNGSSVCVCVCVCVCV